MAKYKTGLIGHNALRKLMELRRTQKTLKPGLFLGYPKPSLLDTTITKIL